MRLKDLFATRSLGQTGDIAVLVMRLILGWVFTYHGAGKLFGWFGGFGITGTGGYFDSIGLTPGSTWALLIGLLECGGGLAMVVGFGVRIAGTLLALEMLGIIVKVNWVHGLIVEKPGGGYEINLALGALALGVALLTAGPWSVDRLLNKEATTAIATPTARSSASAAR